MTERWRNPWPRLPTYSEAHQVSEQFLRIRAGARHACARLRDRNQKLAASMAAYLAQHDRELARARDAGITYEAVREILGRLDNEEISFGKAVELLRTLAVVAAEKDCESADDAAFDAIAESCGLDATLATREKRITELEAELSRTRWERDQAREQVVYYRDGGAERGIAPPDNDICAALGIEVEGG